MLGGCDGCLNIRHPDNKGLESLLADLEQFYLDEGFDDLISRLENMYGPDKTRKLFPRLMYRADMWALLGIWSIQESIKRNNEDCLRCHQFENTGA